MSDASFIPYAFLTDMLHILVLNSDEIFAIDFQVMNWFLLETKTGILA